jgi:hypothetical protein
MVIYRHSVWLSVVQSVFESFKTAGLVFQDGLCYDLAGGCLAPSRIEDFFLSPVVKKGYNIIVVANSY